MPATRSGTTRGRTPRPRGSVSRSVPPGRRCVAVPVVSAIQTPGPGTDASRRTCATAPVRATAYRSSPLPKALPAWTATRELATTPARYGTLRASLAAAARRARSSAIGPAARTSRSSPAASGDIVRTVPFSDSLSTPARTYGAAAAASAASIAISTIAVSSCGYWRRSNGALVHITRTVTLPLGLEALERRLDQVGQRAQVVSALEDRGHARREAARAARELPEAVCGHEHVCERILGVGVEPGRHEQQLRLERRHRPLHRLPRLEVPPIARSCRERDVDEGRPLLVRAAGAWIERPLVERDEEDRRVVRQQVLRPVAVVDVPVDDRDAADAELGLRPARGDRDRVEQAKAHRAVSLRVVAGRPRERERAAADGLDRCAGREQRGLERRLGAGRVRVDEPAGRADLVDEALRVAAQHVGLRRRLALHEREPLVQSRDSLLGLGVRARRVEVRERAVAYELDACWTSSRISDNGRSPRWRPTRYVRSGAVRRSSLVCAAMRAILSSASTSSSDSSSSQPISAATRFNHSFIARATLDARPGSRARAPRRALRRASSRAAWGAGRATARRHPSSRRPGRGAAGLRSAGTGRRRAPARASRAASARRPPSSGRRRERPGSCPTGRRGAR